MPAQIVPPMYRMLDEELTWAKDEVRARSLSAGGSRRAGLRDGGCRAPLESTRSRRAGADAPHRRTQNEPYHFSHLLFLSRVFRSSASALEDDPNAALEATLVAEESARAASAPKKKKGRKAGDAPGERDEERMWWYHAEDEVVEKVRPGALSPFLRSKCRTDARAARSCRRTSTCSSTRTSAGRPTAAPSSLASTFAGSSCSCRGTSGGSSSRASRRWRAGRFERACKVACPRA